MVCVSFIYLPKTSVYYNLADVDYFETLEEGVRKYSEVGKIVIAGDLNARTGDRDDGTTPVSAFTKYIHTIDGVEDVKH